jgi:hypothetical protein
MLDGYQGYKGSDQERFLKEQAVIMEKKGMSRTYLALDPNDTGKILGYVSIGLRCMSVPDDTGVSGGFGKKMNIDPESKVAQSYLIGQLSRSTDADSGLGRMLLKEALGMFDKANLIVGCRLVRVDCTDELIDYYKGCGFSRVTKNKAKDLNQMAYILTMDE